MTLRQALAAVAAQIAFRKMDETTLLRLAEDLAIRFALERFQRGEVKVNAVRQMLDRMGNELATLRKLLKSREEKLANAGTFGGIARRRARPPVLGRRCRNPASARC